MIGMGDEVRRTQKGNNNAYGQDNETSWFDWRLLETHADILEFTQKLIQLRLSMSLTQRDEQDASLNEILRGVSVTWHGTKLNQPDWPEHSHSLALTARSLSQRHLFHIMLNAYWDALEFELPPSPAKTGWKRVVDTWLAAPEDISHPDSAPAVLGNRYLVQPRSLVVLAARRQDEFSIRPAQWETPRRLLKPLG